MLANMTSKNELVQSFHLRSFFQLSFFHSLIKSSHSPSRWLLDNQVVLFVIIASCFQGDCLGSHL